jgi:hypothetical protein
VAPPGAYVAPAWVPWAGAAACVARFVAEAWMMLTGSL